MPLRGELGQVRLVSLEEAISIPDPFDTPEERIIGEELRARQRELIEEYIGKRSIEEQGILQLFLEGQSTHQIARNLGRQVRGVNRAIDKFTSATKSWMQRQGVESEDVL